MKRAFFTSVLAVLSIFGVFGATPSCLAWDGWRSCCCCSWPHGCAIIDDCTRCAWRRTWHAPNALDTPLRGYYIPRPPQCCYSADYASGCGYDVQEMYAVSQGMQCDCPDTSVPPTEISRDGAAGFSPVQYERLGQVRNELDVAGAVPGTPARAATPAR